MKFFKKEKPGSTVELIPMTIRFDCTKCGQKFKVAKEYAGHTASCPSCNVEVQIPTLEHASVISEESASVPNPTFISKFKNSEIVRLISYFIRKPYLVGGVIILLLALGCIYFYTTKPDKDLNVELKFTELGEITVINRSSFEWTNVRFKLNSDYFMHLDKIPPGNQCQFSLMKFYKPNGERFNFLTYAILDVSVRCDTPTGKGYWETTYR